MYLRFLLYALVIYLLYRFIFHFIIPVVKTTRQVKSQFRDMQSRMQENMNQNAFNQNANDMNPGNSKKATVKNEGADYIDFEEVK